MGFFSVSTIMAGAARPLPTIAKCGACGLYKHCRTPKPAPGGTGRTKLIVVGDFPGTEDDRQGRLFIGTGGELLRRCLADAGADLEDCTYTNAAICHPGKTTVGPEHVEWCAPNLTAALAAVPGAVVVPLGHLALRGVLGTEWGGEVGPAARWAGFAVPSAFRGTWVCPTHAMQDLIYAKQAPVFVRMVTQHLRAALDRVGTVPEPLTLAELKPKVELIKDPRQMRLRLRGLAEKAGRLGFDYETTGLKPERPEQKIHTASFCLNGADTFAGRIDETCHGELSRVLRNPRLRKVASNLKFEERWSIQKLGHGVAGWEHDTMLAAHVLDNREGITSIKFQAYVYLGIGDYDFENRSYFVTEGGANGLNRIHEAPLDDLLLYNGLDSLLEYLVAEKQMEAIRGGVR